MREFSFLLEFEERYGLKESIVLNEICKKVLALKNSDVFFDFDEIKQMCSFLTDAQLRRIIENLFNKNCLSKSVQTFGHNNFQHKNVYQLDASVFCEYSKHHKQHIYDQFLRASGY
ncbi:MAG: hypothetical protein Ta2B_05650 [Termitinemataceae bacterium]|nr:MAG: hypothetical protein Ta2B_05650 [Termitinemataceae bacterium]